MPLCPILIGQGLDIGIKQILKLNTLSNSTTEGNEPTNERTGINWKSRIHKKKYQNWKS